MNESFFSEDSSDAPHVSELKKQQRRVLGVLVEKAFTTPEYYPLTLKAVTAACNQKSNRSPVYQLSEDDVLDTLDSLRELGLVSVRHTESGRTERYRHNMRKRFSFTEPQLAIMIELLLRGRQSMGELRTRASRMVPIESLADLRAELRGLIETGYVQTDGPLERRGIQVDHAMYLPSEGKTMEAASSAPTISISAQSDKPREPAPSTPIGRIDAEITEKLSHLELTIERQAIENRGLRDEFEKLSREVEQLREQLDNLCRDLGS